MPQSTDLFSSDTEIRDRAIAAFHAKWGIPPMAGGAPDDEEDKDETELESEEDADEGEDDPTPVRKSRQQADEDEADDDEVREWLESVIETPEIKALIKESAREICFTRPREDNH